MPHRLENNEKKCILRSIELAQTNLAPCEILDFPQPCAGHLLITWEMWHSCTVRSVPDVSGKSIGAETSDNNHSVKLRHIVDESRRRVSFTFIVRSHSHSLLTY